MSKVGRNDPCPCGSGKKYKKCCIDKPLPKMEHNSFKLFLNNFWTYDAANNMSTEEIIEKLHSMGIVFEKEAFLKDAEKFYSAEQLSENWFNNFKVTAVGRDEDFPWVAAWVLWERMVPENKMSMEQMADLIDKGFEKLNVNDPRGACDIWLRVWEAIKYRSKPELKTLEYLEKQYEGSFFVRNFCQDLEIELHNAGLQDPRFFEKRIKYCREFCSLFPDEDEMIIHNMRRAIIESFIWLNNFDEAKKGLDNLVNDYPNNPWSYIEYGDMYWFGDDFIKDPMKAKEFYDKALKVAKDKHDIIAIEERLEDLNQVNCK